MCTFYIDKCKLYRFCIDKYKKYKVGYGIVTNTWKININIIIVKHGKSNLNQFTWWERSSCFLWESVLECHAMESSFFYFRCIYYHSFCYIMGLDNCHLLIGVSSSRPFFFPNFFYIFISVYALLCGRCPN